jgi:cell division protein FtsL
MMRALVAGWFRERVSDPAEADLKRRVTTMLVVTLVLGLVLVWFNLMVQDLGYRIETTGRLVEKLDIEYAELESEVTRETTPDRLRKEAEAVLGLGVPRAGQVMMIDAEP